MNTTPIQPANITPNVATLVTAFIVDINQRTNIDQYIENGRKLLNIKVPKVIFMDASLMYRFTDIDTEYNKLVPTTKDDIYTFKLKSEITNFSIITTNQSKDTIDYMLLICNKTEWMRQAIEINHFNTKQFIWIDFGIYYIYGGQEFLFQRSVELMCQRTYDKVRIASIVDYGPNENIYHSVHWFFAGGVFGGDINSLIKFANLMKERTQHIIRTRHTLMWEVNIWALIYMENKDLFHRYKCDHDATITFNY